MRAIFIVSKYTSKPKLQHRKRVTVKRPAFVDRAERLSPCRLLRPAQSMTDDEEIALFAKAAFWIVLFGVTPLILYLIIHWFYPNFLMSPITPV